MKCSRLFKVALPILLLMLVISPAYCSWAFLKESQTEKPAQTTAAVPAAEAPKATVQEAPTPSSTDSAAPLKELETTFSSFDSKATKKLDDIGLSIQYALDAIDAVQAELDAREDAIKVQEKEIERFHFGIGAGVDWSWPLEFSPKVVFTGRIKNILMIAEVAYPYNGIVSMLNGGPVVAPQIKGGISFVWEF